MAVCQIYISKVLQEQEELQMHFLQELQP